mmetsp:Transcript_46131/g.107935  ORF Transcript_46131/g.107935 Transcript_46131/m.107935 type:complete len:899 (-) Transcript_46131:266-2962(-)
MPPPTLANAISASHGGDDKQGVPVEKVRWLECFTDKENVSEFCAATDPSGNLESNSSAGHKEYQDRLRAIALRKEGYEKADIAKTIGRSTRFVQTWWRKEPKEVPKPAGVHDYLRTDFWRDIEIVRGFGKGQKIYEDALKTMEWVQPMADGREFKNGGGYRLKYDKEGRMRPQGNQHAKDGILPGRLPELDKLIQKVMVEQGIDDRVLKRPGLLWYPDGNADAIVHRHEAWTALMSFGSPRILTIDGHPVLLRDGDLIVFGTQRHGVPKMYTEGSTFGDYGGRMSVVMFFMPTGQQATGAAPWQAIHDVRDAPSRKAVAMLRDSTLGHDAQVRGLLTGEKAEEMQQLMDFGFDVTQAAAALKAARFDVATAVEMLLQGCVPLLADSCDACIDRSSQIAALLSRLEEIQNSKWASLQDERTPKDFEDGAWEESAILEQLEELQRDEAVTNSALATQFAQYEEMIDAEDAEQWDGRGDLMVREWRRQHLHIEQQDPSTLYSLGCGSMSERSFFELLSLHSIRVLYDFRAEGEAGPLHFKPGNFESACKRHSVHYRYAPLGRQGAYGILKHLQEDEGRNMLAELVWWARRRRTAFLGMEEDWRQDHRAAIAARLTTAGHSVKHVSVDGGTQDHPRSFQMPDFISSEEARLRKLEKQRLSGEPRSTKSGVSRSTEAIAQRLTQPAKVIDAAAELRKANTQAELCRIQRRLADLERRSTSSDAKAGLGPKMLHVNKWVKAQAEQQRENLAAGKTKDGKEKDKLSAGGPAPSYSWTGGGGTCGGNPDFSAFASASNVEEVLMICNGCEVQASHALVDDSGFCPDCRAAVSAALQEEEGVPCAAPADAVTAEVQAPSAAAEHMEASREPIATANRWARRSKGKGCQEPATAEITDRTSLESAGMQ